MPDSIRHPATVTIEKFGFRVKPGMTNQKVGEHEYNR